MVWRGKNICQGMQNAETVVSMPKRMLFAMSNVASVTCISSALQVLFFVKDRVGTKATV